MNRDAPATLNGKRIGVVIVDHGSKREESNAMLEQFGQLYTQTTGRGIVETAHMEIAAPSILDAVDKCVQRGATHVVIAPYFLSKGRHIQKDIPLLVQQAREVHPGMRIEVADPIGALCLHICKCSGGQWDAATPRVALWSCSGFQCV